MSVTKDEVIAKLSDIGKQIYDALEAGEYPSLEYPTSSEANVEFNIKTREYKLKGKKSIISAGNIGQVGMFGRLVWLARICKELVSKSESSTLRGIFYTLMGIPEPLKLTKERHGQSYSNNLVELLERITGIPREALGIEAELKGTIVGPMKLKVENKLIDYSKAGQKGYPIPSIRDSKFVDIDADAIVVVEKSEMRLRLYGAIPKKLNTVLIDSKGFLTRDCLGLLRMIYDKTQLPVVMLNDFDFGGLNIFVTAKNYSISSAHIPHLNVPNLQLLGVRCDDIQRYFGKYPDVIEKAKEYDITNAKRTLKLIEEGKKQQFIEVKPDLEYLVKEQKILESPAFNRISLDAASKYVRDKLKEMNII